VSRLIKGGDKREEDSLYAGIGLDIDNDIEFDMGVVVCIDTTSPVEE
jgi:hypothetical protein